MLRIQYSTSLVILLLTIFNISHCEWSTTENIRLELIDLPEGQLVIRENYRLKCRLLSAGMNSLPEYLSIVENQFAPFYNFTAKKISTTEKYLRFYKQHVEQENICELFLTLSFKPTVRQ